MQINDLVFYKGQQMRVIRGAPVRYGEKRVVVERVRDGRRFTVSVSLLTKRPPDALHVYDAGEIAGVKLTVVNGMVFATPAKRR